MKVGIQDSNIGLRVHNYQLICSYEYDFLIRKDAETLRWHCRAFSNYLNNKSLSSQIQDMYFNMIEYVNWLIEKDGDLEQKRVELKENPNVASRKWLIEKITLK